MHNFCGFGDIHLSIYIFAKINQNVSLLTIHFFVYLVFIAHIVDGSLAKIDISDEKVAFLIEFGTYVR